MYAVLVFSTQTKIEAPVADFLTLILSSVPAHAETNAFKTRPPQLIVSELAGKVPKFVDESSK